MENFNVGYPVNCVLSLVRIPLINCRKVVDRPRDPAKWGEIADIVAALSIPVIANGDVFEYDDFQRIKTATGSHNYYSSNDVLFSPLFSYELLNCLILVIRVEILKTVCILQL